MSSVRQAFFLSFFVCYTQHTHTLLTSPRKIPVTGKLEAPRYIITLSYALFYTEIQNSYRQLKGNTSHALFSFQNNP